MASQLKDFEQLLVAEDLNGLAGLAFESERVEAFARLNRFHEGIPEKDFEEALQAFALNLVNVKNNRTGQIDDKKIYTRLKWWLKWLDQTDVKKLEWQLYQACYTHWRNTMRNQKREREWLRARVSSLLDKDQNQRFFGRGDKGAREYGLSVWRTDGFNRGSFNSNWTTDDALVKKLKCYSGFCRVEYFKDENESLTDPPPPYSDDDLLRGCVQLLEACERFCRPFELVDGFQAMEWVALNNIHAPLLLPPDSDANSRMVGKTSTTDDGTQSNDQAVSKYAEMYRWHIQQILASFGGQKTGKKEGHKGREVRERRQRVFLNYWVPESIEQKKSSYPSQTEISNVEGVSPQLIHNDLDVIGKCLHSYLAELPERTAQDILDFLARMFENGELELLIHTGH